MAAAGDFTDELLRRTRDTGATATSRAQVLSLLTQAQRTINLMHGLVLDEVAFTLEPQRAIYDVQGLDPTPGRARPRVLGVRYDGVDLVKAGPGELGQSDPAWLRRFAPQPHTWSPIGGNLIAIWPAPQRERLEVTLVLVARLEDLEEATPIQLPSGYHNACLDLAEALIWIRRRQPTLAEAAFKRMKG